jgi:hypothetical protein
VLFLAKRNRPKQGADRAERAQAIGRDYATVEGGKAAKISPVIIFYIIPFNVF